MERDIERLAQKTQVLPPKEVKRRLENLLPDYLLELRARLDHLQYGPSRIDTGGGISTFTGLFDTPSAYSGNAGRVVQVNATPDGLEFGQRLRPEDTPTFTGLKTGTVQAKDANGLGLYDDAGNLGMFVEDGGQVGIGTTSPGALLDVYGTSNKLRLSYDGANYADIFTNSNGDLNIDTSGEDINLNANRLQEVGAHIYFTSSYSEIATTLHTIRFWQGDGGSVGVRTKTGGTTVPVRFLVNRQETNIEDDVDQGDLTVYRDIDGGGSYSEAGSLLRLQRDITNVTSEDGNFLAWGTGPYDGTFSIMGVIDKEGQVGIGTDAPNYLLDVNGGRSGRALSSDPADPPSGQHVVWQSDGTGSGADGDIMMKITNLAGTTKLVTLVDYSAA